MHLLQSHYSVKNFKMISILKKCFRFLGFDVIRKRHRNFDEIILECFEKVQTTPRIIVDVGAHMGESIDRFNFLFRTPMIYAFEANPSLSKKLLKKFRESNVKIFSIGLGDVPELKVFNIHKSSSGSSSFLEVNPDDKFAARRGISESNTEKTVIKVETLDGLCSEGRIPEQIDFLKIDTQGTELNVLRGASHLLKNSHIKFIELEIIISSVYINQEKWSSTIDYLLGHGYNLVALSNDSRFYNLGPFDILNNPELQIDCLFASQGIYERLLHKSLEL